MPLFTREGIQTGWTKCSVLCSFTVQVIAGLIWTVVGIAMIVVGAIHKNDCAAEPNIPIFLIVAGAFSLSYWILLPLEFWYPTIRKILLALIVLFLFAWYIAGSVWVFRIYNSDPRDCHNGMYLFAFSILIVHYIFIGLDIILGLVVCFCCCR